MSIKVELLTREYPPFVYGGAGVHVEELSYVLRDLLGEENLKVRSFEGPRDAKIGGGDWVFGYNVPSELKDANPALATLGVDLEIADQTTGADLVHSHTWYANFAGFLSSKLYNIPHIISAHSLEPLRPWKREQLGGGYELSSWVEKTAYEDATGIIAVSQGMKDDILKCYPSVDPEKVFVVHNGIDLDSFKRTGEPTDVLDRYKIDTTKPTAVFVGRITRQKGLPYFLDSIKLINPEIQVILCAGAPDTKEIAEQVASAVEELNETRGNIIWIEEMLPKFELVEVLNASDAFICPSVYEPLGIVNLEAMALKLPVVASATGGIPEVVVDNETGYLVPFRSGQVQDGTGTPNNPQEYVEDFASAITKMFDDLDRAKAMGEKGYERARDHFSWKTIGKRTVEVYQQVIDRFNR
ncbi:glycosyl transferase [Actinomycetota bacterium]|nr:glycosyl transferase [Actinomycetota bacterium]